MVVVQWIGISVGALSNEGVPKLAGCLKHQLQHWAHFAFYFFLPTFWWISTRMAQCIELSVGTLGDEGVPKLAGCLKYQFQHLAHFVIFFLSLKTLVNFYACGSTDWVQYWALSYEGLLSWLDAWSTSSNIGFILQSFFFLHTFRWISMVVAQWIGIGVGALDDEGAPKLAGCLKHQLQHWAHFLIFYHFPNILVNFYACGSMDWTQCWNPR
jgi:hypothetical protein